MKFQIYILSDVIKFSNSLADFDTNNKHSYRIDLQKVYKVEGF